MNNRDRFTGTMNYEPVDRVPHWLFSPWPETEERWQQEGYDPAPPFPC